MPATVFIYNTETGSFQWVIQDSDGQVSEVKSGDLASLATACQGHPAILILPGTETLLTRVSLPTRNRQKVLQALPYALEDQIIEDIDQLHFAIPKLGKQQDEIPVCAISRNKLATLLSTLNESGIQPTSAISAIQCLPGTPGQWSILIEEKLTTARTGINSGFSLDTSCLPSIFEILLGQTDADHIPDHIRILDCRSQEDMATAYLPDTSEDQSIEIESFARHPLQLFAENYLPDQSINLLQGEFSVRRKRLKLSRKWIPIAALVLLTLCLQLVSWIVEYVHLNTRLATQNKQIESIFRQAIPGASRIVNPKAQMQQRLDELMETAASSGGDFLGMMDKAGKVFIKQKDLVLNAVQYRNRELDIELVVHDLQTLDSLKQQLKQVGMDVEIRSASASGDQVNGRIKLKDSM